MSEERETQPAGAPVEEAEATSTEVLAAVDRAGDLAVDAVEPGATAALLAEPAHVDAGADVERPLIAAADELPSAGPSTPAVAALDLDAIPVAAPAQSPGTAPGAPAAAAPAQSADNRIVISPDHPMAALYLQTPAPPVLRGNRGAGALISLLATVVFAAVYAGVLALWLAPSYPPSTFLEEGLLPWVLSWGFLAASGAFFVATTLLVLIVGKAGWWAYVLGGFLVAAVVWAASVIGYAYLTHLWGGEVLLTPLGLIEGFGLTVPVIAAALVAREVVIWAGAWIGSRGRRVGRRNAEAVAEYEASLAEAQAKPQ